MDQETWNAELEVKIAEGNLNAALEKLNKTRKPSLELAKEVESLVFTEISKFSLVQPVWIQSSALAKIIDGILPRGVNGVMMVVKKMSRLNYFQNISTDIESWPHRGPGRRRGVLFTASNGRRPCAVLYLEQGEIKCMPVHPTRADAKEANKEVEPLPTGVPSMIDTVRSKTKLDRILRDMRGFDKLREMGTLAKRVQPAELSTAQQITRDVFAKLEPLNALSESVTNNFANRQAITGVVEAAIQAALDQSRDETPKVLTDALNRVTSLAEENARLSKWTTLLNGDASIIGKLRYDLALSEERNKTIRGELSNQMEHIEQLRDYANQLEIAGDALHLDVTRHYIQGPQFSYEEMKAWREARKNAR